MDSQDSKEGNAFQVGRKDPVVNCTELDMELDKEEKAEYRQEVKDRMKDLRREWANECDRFDTLKEDHLKRLENISERKEKLIIAARSGKKLPKDHLRTIADPLDVFPDIGSLVLTPKRDLI